MTQILVTGSLAFDYIMGVDGRFSERLSTKTREGFSAAFIAPTMHRQFGGCAGNIAYGLRKLGESPVLMATVGEDFSPYRRYLKQHKIDDSHVKTIYEMFTAQAFIVGDDDKSQLIMFHPGATGEAHRQSINDLSTPPTIAIVGPNGKEGILRFGRELSEAKVPFIFDPGQAIVMFSADELNEMMACCNIAIFNLDEYAAAKTIIGKKILPNDTQALIITHGNAGSEVITGDTKYRTSAADFGDVVDTTGCGDAYRAGLIYGLTHDWTWLQSIRYASVLAGINSMYPGGQGYSVTASEAMAKTKQLFG